MTRHAIAYLRKSRVLNGHTVSWEMQEEAVRALASRHGQSDLLILSDWNRSGRETSRRPGYRQMVGMIEANEIGAIYAYSLSRLSRSTQDFAGLVRLCQDHDVEIHLHNEPHLDFSRATGRMIVNILAAIAEMEADVARERSLEGIAVRRARGDRIGHPFYGDRPGEDADAVVRAYRQAGSVLGGAKLLNLWNVPTRQGRPWSTTSVRETLLHQGAMPRRGRPGVKAEAPFAFYRLLTCHCGATLTGSRYRNGPDPAYTVYKCIRGRSRADHGVGSVVERRILTWAQDEAARLAIPFDQAEIREQDRRKRSELDARRQRVIDNYEDGLIDKAARDMKIGAIADSIEVLESVERIVDIPKIDWTREPKAVNAGLRALWSEIRLGPDMSPIEAVWTVPEWRA